MRSLLGFPIRRPFAVLALVLAVTGFFATRIYDPVDSALKLRIDPSFDAILPDDAEARVYYEWVKEEFGDDQSLIISLVVDDVFSLENLQMIQRITDLLEEAEGVDYVTSLATADHIGSVGDGVDTRPFLDPPPETEADAERIRNALHGNPVYSGNLVSSDATAAAFIVYVDDTPEQEFTDRGLDLRMRDIVKEASGDADVFISGTAQMRSATSRALKSDLTFMLPLVILLMAIIAFVSYRSPRGVVVPLLTILVATLWTLGLMAWFDIPINLITTIVPILLLTIGFAYSVHMVADYYKAFRKDPAVVEAAGGPAGWGLRNVSLPVALTCLTTVAGFMSLTISPFPAVRAFGLVSVFGVIATTLLTLTFAPALLQALRLPKQNQIRVEAGKASSRFDELALSAGRYAIEHRREFMVGGAALALLTLWGLYHIRVDTHLITNFSPTNPVRIDFNAINESLEGARPFSVVLSSEEDEAFLEPANLRALDELASWLTEQPEIGGATSFADYVKLLNRSFHEDEPDYLVIPDSATLTKQYLLFGETDDLEDYVASNYQNTLIRVRSNCETTNEIAQLVDRIEERMADLPPGIKAGVTGNTVVLAQSIDAIAQGQIESLSIAAVFIYLILAILFASLRMGFFGLVPNILPVLVFFGILGLSGVPLTATTGLIACVVLGIAVDDTIHFMIHFNEEAREAADERIGAINALKGLARPVTITSLGLCLGFLVFTTGELRNQAEFGALAAIVLAFAWAVDLTFTPALCSGLHVVTLWDALTFDLGEEPQKSIPMFGGLSKTQARLTALVTSVERISGGTQVFRTGDAGESLFVVIDGELSVSLTNSDGRKIEIARARRGDVVGEIGLYHGKRTADVAALTDVRVLNLNAENLARLKKRYPRIASQILWNLSEIMASRLAKATERESELTVHLGDSLDGIPTKA